MACRALRSSVTPAVRHGVNLLNISRLKMLAYTAATPKRYRGGWSALMRIKLWIVLAILLALLAATRYLHYRGDTQRICIDDPTASVCHR